MQKKIILERLVFIKYLFTQANNQAKMPEPLNASSILIYHDAIELFLNLCAEKYNHKVEKHYSFMNYWTGLNRTLKKVKKQLEDEAIMSKFNDLRTALKHHGTLPSKSDIEKYSALCNAFFEKSCKDILDIDIDDISLLDLVSNEKVKEYLSSAETHFSKKDSKNTSISLALAFECLIYDYQIAKEGQMRRSPFDFSTNIGSPPDNCREKDHDGYFNNLGHSIEFLSGTLKIVCLGIDYKKYSRFSLLTPQVERRHKSQEPITYGLFKPKLSRQEFEFCFNFIIESALKLKEFDYDFKDDFPSGSVPLEKWM